MFVCCSFTARKGLNILIYWIIVRVLSSSRPYQALIFQTKANNQIRSATKLSLSFESSRPLQLGWKLVLGAAPPIHSSQVIGNLTKFKWKLSLSSKQSSSRSTRPAHKLIENWMILYENKRIEKNLQPPSSHYFHICFKNNPTTRKLEGKTSLAPNISWKWNYSKIETQIFCLK